MFVIGQNTSFYDYTVEDIDGNEFYLDQLKGKKVMVVNVASKCGFTPQYEQLEAIYTKYRNENFIIIGFPANNFMRQEPGTNKEIKSFCTLNYGVTFPIMSKISVKGKDKAPIYQWLTEEELCVYSSEFARNGFQGGLQWYRGARCASELLMFYGCTINVPSSFIAGVRDWGVYQRPGSQIGRAHV